MLQILAEGTFFASLGAFARFLKDAAKQAHHVAPATRTGKHASAKYGHGKGQQAGVPDEKRFRRASAITSDIESLRISSTARVPVGSMAVDRKCDVLIWVSRRWETTATGTLLLSRMLACEWRSEWRLTPCSPTFRLSSTRRAQTVGRIECAAWLAEKSIVIVAVFSK